MCRHVCRAVHAAFQSAQTAVKYAAVMNSPVGILTLLEENGALAEVRFGRRCEDASLACTPLLLQTERELSEYFAGYRKVFTVPLAPEGTPFQQSCWQALLQIPYGESRTYGQQAAQIGRPKACRAVGMANHRNPIPILIPCHRVSGANGKLTGYAGGLDIKEILLQIERMNSV